LIIIGEGLTVVSDPGSPISKLYNPLFDFTGGFKSDVDASSINSRMPRGGMKAFAKGAVARQQRRDKKP